MKRTRILSVLGFLVLGALAWTAMGQSAIDADSLTVDQIIERNIEAIGGWNNIKALQNLVYSEGMYIEGSYSSDSATMSLGRPYFKLVGNKNKPGDYMEGYDGSAWEYFRDPGVVIRTVGPSSEAIRHYAGVEGPLFDYLKKGSVAILKGKAEFDGRAVVVIEITRRDGFVEQFYLDRETFMIVASRYDAPIHAFGDAVTSLTRISDYRAVAGVMIAHRFESVELATERTTDSMQWGKIEANRDLPPNWFSPPSFDRTPMQAFIEQLYDQRTDFKSVMWTYGEFRRAHPDMETSNAVNIAGFQTLKMGNINGAIALLEQNAKDYPGLAEVRFGLGRAYRSAGRIEDAREQFQTALEIEPDHARATAALASIGE